MTHNDGRKSRIEPAEDHRWQKAIEALQGMLCDPTRGQDEAEFSPSLSAIGNALAWLHHLRTHDPSISPTLVLQDPLGGIILERKFEDTEGDEIIEEFTFPNKGVPEFTKYVNGKVLFIT